MAIVSVRCLICQVPCIRLFKSHYAITVYKELHLHVLFVKNTDWWSKMTKGEVLVGLGGKGLKCTQNEIKFVLFEKIVKW